MDDWQSSSTLKGTQTYFSFNFSLSVDIILILCLITNTTFQLRHINKLQLKYSISRLDALSGILRTCFGNWISCCLMSSRQVNRHLQSRVVRRVSLDHRIRLTDPLPFKIWTETSAVWKPFFKTFQQWWNFSGWFYDYWFKGWSFMETLR